VEIKTDGVGEPEGSSEATEFDPAFIVPPTLQDAASSTSMFGRFPLRRRRGK
jgi:hypothetical protein